MRLNRYLTELFRTDVDVDVQTRNSRLFVGKFIVGDILYTFVASLYDEVEGWHIAFTADKELVGGTWKYKRSDRESILGSGNAALVFAAVIKLFKMFLKEYRPHRFHFYGKEPSRQKLYDRFAKMILKFGGYDFDKFTDPTFPGFGQRYDFQRKKRKVIRK